MFEETRGTGKQVNLWNPVDDIAKYVPVAQLSRASFDTMFYRSILFYCLDGATKIPCLDGRERTIQEIAESGTEHWVFGFDTETLKVVPALMERAWLTGEKECIEVFFEEGTSVVCTADHRLLTWKRGYVEAGNLQPGDSLVPFYKDTHHSSGKPVKNISRSTVLQPADAVTEFVHRMVAADEYGPIPKGFEVDHINQDPKDNRPENLQILTKRAHQQKTTKENWHVIGPALKKAFCLRKPEIVAKAEASRKAYWAKWGTKKDRAMRKAAALRGIATRRAKGPITPRMDGLQKFWASKTPEEKLQIWRKNQAAGAATKRAKRLANHRVKKIVRVGPRKVYDATVPRTSNFALSAGIFAHNCGTQWIRFDGTRQSWAPIALPSWFPKNQTNKYAVAIDGMKSVFEQARPATIFAPGSGDEADVATAEACQDITSVIDNEVDQERLRSEAAALLVLTGNAFVVDGYDMSPMNGTKSVRSLMCASCAFVGQPHEFKSPACPQCGSGAILPAIGKDGQPVVEEYPIGKMESTVESPFGMLFDMQAEYLDNSPFLINAKTYPIDELKGMFPDFAEQLGSGQPVAQTGLFYQAALAYAVGSMGLSGSPSMGGQQGHRGTLYRLRRKACKELPYGGEALIINETVVWKGELSTKADDGTPFYPVTHFGFKKVPGRVFYKTPAEDLISKQIQRNKIEALVQLGAERVSNPTWLLPTGIGIEGITGEPGEKLTYNPHLGFKPERIAGQDMPNSLYRWLQLIDEDFADLAATYDVLLGKHPEGVDTLGGMQLLRDRGIARFQDGLNSWGRGWTRVRRNRIMIWKQRVKDDRTLRVLGDNGKWDMKKFNSATIAGSIDVKPEEASFMPKSKAYEQMMASQLLSAGLVDAADPLERWKLLNTFDAADLARGLDLDVKDAIKERETFLETGYVRPREVVDNHEVHLAQHVRDAKGDAFFEWTPDQQMAWIAHLTWHFQVLMQRAQMAQEQDPAFARAKMQNDALGQKIALEMQALAMKKEIDLKSKVDLSELKIHQGALKSAEAEMKVAAAARKGLDS